MRLSRLHPQQLVGSSCREGPCWSPALAGRPVPRRHRLKAELQQSFPAGRTYGLGFCFVSLPCAGPAGADLSRAAASAWSRFSCEGGGYVVVCCFRRFSHRCSYPFNHSLPLSKMALASVFSPSCQWAIARMKELCPPSTFLDGLDRASKIACPVKRPAQRLQAHLVPRLQLDGPPGQFESQSGIAERLGGRGQEVGDHILVWIIGRSLDRVLDYRLDQKETSCKCELPSLRIGPDQGRFFLVDHDLAVFHGTG